MSTGILKTIEAIVNRGNDTDIYNLLKSAIKKNKPNYVKPLFKAAKVDDVSAALILACENGHIEIVRMLLTRSDIDVNKTDGSRFTALMYAITEGNIEIVQILLTRSDIDVNMENRWGCTALVYAILNGHIEIVKMLLTRSDIDVNRKYSLGRTALMIASWKGRTEIVQMLLDRSDIDVNKADNDGRTALTRLIYYYGNVRRYARELNALPIRVSRKIAELLVIYGCKLMNPPGDRFIVSMNNLLGEFALACKADYEALLVFRLCLQKVLHPPKKRRRTPSGNPEGSCLKRFSAEGIIVLPLIESFLIPCEANTFKPNMNVRRTLEMIITTRESKHSDALAKQTPLS